MGMLNLQEFDSIIDNLIKESQKGPLNTVQVKKILSQYNIYNNSKYFDEKMILKKLLEKKE